MLRLFETVCLDLLDIYHDTNKEHTMQSIENAYPVWGNRSLLEVAGDTDFKGFVAHQATQEVTLKMWNGKVIPTDLCIQHILNVWFGVDRNKHIFQMLLS